MNTNDKQSKSKQPSPSNIKIMIIDDEIFIGNEYAKRIKSVLIQCQVETATDPDNAIEKISAFNPDLILLDMYMPNNMGISTITTGLSLLSEIKKTHDHVPVVILSGLNDSLMMIEAFRLGASYYINKFEQPSKFLSAIKSELDIIESIKANNKRDRIERIKWRLEKSREKRDLCDEKLESLEKSRILTIDESTKFTLGKYIQDIQNDIKKYEEDIQILENELEQYGK